MRWPLRSRLAISSCVVFLFVIALLELAAYISVRGAIHSIVDHELETRLAGIDDHLARHIPKMSWPKLAETLNEHPAFQPDHLRIQTADGRTLLEGSGLRGVDVPTPGTTISFDTIGGPGRTLRILTVSRGIDGRLYRLIIATDLYASAKILSKLWLLMLISLPAVLLISGGAGYWISGRALAPVSSLIAAAQAVDSTRLNERIPVPATGDEIQSLAETMNAMLARIEDGFQQVRQFTANASHELRTPLAIIRANAEVALLESMDKTANSSREVLGRAQAALRSILREAERDSAMLENMLRLAHADAGIGTEPALLRVVDLTDSLRMACADIKPLAEARGVHLRVCAKGVCPCQGDEEQLRRLWLVLLDNGVKYSNAGGTVSASAGINSGNRPFVTIVDTGIGMDVEHLSRIFERFYRVDKARSRREGGAGLGLSIAQQIAARHGAAIDVESRPGRGSCFTVTFAQRSAAPESSGNSQVSVTLVQ